MLPASLVPLLEAQLDLMTRRQALESGMSPAALRWAIARSWQVVLPGVVHVHRVRLTLEQKRVAALLYAGRWAALAGLTAARWYGLERADDRGVVRVVVPARCSARRTGWVDVARTQVPYLSQGDGVVRVVEPARAVVEAARTARGPEDAQAIVIEGVQKRLVALEELVSVNDLLGRRHSRQATDAIAAAADGAWSLPEAALSRLVRRSGVLGEMWCNPVLRASDGTRLVTPDGWFDDVALAVMVHSHAYHSGARWTPTVERDGELAAYGVRVLPITPRSIDREPEVVLARLERAYSEAKRSERPAVHAVRRR